MKKKICFITALIIAMSSMTSVNATRKRYTEQESAENEAVVNTDIDYGTRYYAEPLYGAGNAVQNNEDFEGYHYNGVPITIPDFNRFKDFEAEDIKTMDDAIVDYMGWDFLLGTSDMVDDTIVFKPIEGVTSVQNTIFGYSRRKFGHEKMAFKAKLTSPDEQFNGNWLGISFLCDATQNVQWGGNKGYLICVKEKSIELQRWFGGSQMLINMTENAEFIKLNTWQDYVVDITDIEGGINIKLIIDGQEVFSFDETENESLPEDGYFNLFWAGTELALKPAGTPSISQGEIAVKPDEGDNTTEQKGTDFVDKVEIQNITAISGENTVTIPRVIEKNGVALVPLRAIAEGFGGMVSWSDAIKTATVSYNKNISSFTCTYSEYMYNGGYYTADAETEMIEGNLYVSAKALARAMNMSYSYSDNTVYFTDLNK